MQSLKKKKKGKDLVVSSRARLIVPKVSLMGIWAHARDAGQKNF